MPGPELNYLPIEKLSLSLVHSVRRLRRYFQAHSVTVLTDKSIKPILTKPEKSRRLVKLASELGEYKIHFGARNAIKGQLLVDFLAGAEVQKEQPDKSTSEKKKRKV